MYRNSLKYAQALRANICSKSLITTPKASIMSREVTMTTEINHEKKKNFYNLIGTRQSNSAFIYFNRDHKYNTLSEGVLSDAKRFLESYETDDIVTAVWLQNQGPTFTKGMDMKALLYNVNSNQHTKAYDLLRKTYDFSMFLGSYMKPLIVLLDGEISNAGASMFAARPHVISTPRTKWSLNETSLGYITDCGASFYLSRMPHEVGTYLALTGKVLHGKELEALGLVHSHTYKDLEDLKNEFRDQNATTHRPTDSLRVYGDKYEEARRKRKLEKFSMQKFIQVEFDYRVKERGENPRLVMAELKHRQRLSQHANTFFGAANPTNRDAFDQQELINYTQQFEEMILENIELQNSNEPSKLPLEAINRCFRGSSVEEIFNALEEENSDWARETLEVLKKKSPMSLKLTLRLVREGLKSGWGECYQREYRVACRRINDEEFKRSMEARLINKQKEFNDWTHKRIQDITPEMVNDYFAPLDVDIKTQEYEPLLPKHSLAPVKEYYKTYPDQVRYWLNKQNIKDVEMRQNQLFSVKSFLQRKGIDLNNPLVDINLVRERIYRLDEFNRVQNLQFQRLFEITKTKEDVQKYYETRKNYIDNFFKDTQKADEIIQSTILKSFEEKFEENLKKKKEFASNARKIEKKKTFEKIKSTIMNNRLTKPVQFTQEDKTRNQTNALNAQVPLFFPSNSYESFLDVPNPELSVHPYTQYIDNIKKTRKLNHEYYEAYLKGAITDEEITRFAYEGEVPQGQVPSNLNMTSSLQSYLYKELDPKLEKKKDHYRIIYGEDPADTHRKEYQAQEILSLIEKRQKEVSQLLEEQPNLKQYVIDNVVNETRGRNIAPVDPTLENLTTITPKQEVEKEIKESVENPQTFGQKSFDNILGTHNFVDLDVNALKKGEAKSLFDKASGHLNDKEYLNQFMNMLKLDDQLKETLDPIFNAKGHANEQFADIFKNLLLSIYKKKVQDVLSQEQGKFKNVRPLFTRDGKNALTKEDTKHNEKLFMDVIDDYLVNNTIFEFNRYISSHVFFVFSYMGLIELEKLYNIIGGTLLGRGRRDQEFSSVVALLKQKNIQINNKEELNQILYHLNQISATLCQLFYTYKDQLHFTEDIIFEKYMKIKYSGNRYNLGLRNRRNFVNTILENFKEHYAVQQEIQLLQETAEEEMPKLNEDAYKLALLRPEEAQSSYDLTNAIYATHAYLVGNSRAKMFVPGSVRYLLELEKASKQAIYGKFAGFPVDQITDKEVEIPDYFDRFDLREPLNVWFDKKLKEVIHQYLLERSKFQDIISKEELIALDRDLNRLLQPENIKESVMTSLENDIAALNYYSDIFQSAEVNEGNMDIQMSKVPAMQENHNKSIKNPEALNKFMAYAITIQEKYKHKKTAHVNTLLLSARSQMLNRLYNEAFEEPKPLSSYEEFTKGEKVNEAELDKLKKIEELKTLKKFDINENSSLVLKSLLEDLSEKEGRDPEMRKELEYLFKRHDIAQ